MKICYLGDNSSVHNLKWIEALSKQRDVDLHVTAFNIGPKYKNVNYHFLDKFTGSKADYILNIPKLKSIVKSVKPHLLHAHYASSYGYMASRCNFHPYIITGWGSDIFDSTKNPLLRGMIRRAVNKADALTVLSQIALSEMKKLTDKKVELIPFGVDTTKFFPVQKKNKEKIRIGTIRTLSTKYGVEFLIRAFAILYKKYYNLYLEIVGDGELMESLVKLAEDLEISDRVIFHGYINQQTDFEKYFSILSELDIFVIPSIIDSETFGVACVEASACGIPVVATNVGGLTEVVNDGVSGIIVEPKNFLQISLALEELINNEKQRSQMGEAGRKIVEQNYVWKESVEKMMNVYNNVTNTKNKI